MKALSFRQPWGWAITDLAEGRAKRIENRRWRHLKNGRMPVDLGFKEDFAIHVSATEPTAWDRIGVLHGAVLQELPAEADLRSAIIGLAQIEMVLRCNATQREYHKSKFDACEEWELDQQDRDRFLYDMKSELTTEERHRQIERWWLGPFAFVLTNVRRCKNPVTKYGDSVVKGHLGFWQVPADLELMVRNEL